MMPHSVSHSEKLLQEYIKLLGNVLSEVEQGKGYLPYILKKELVGLVLTEGKQVDYKIKELVDTLYDYECNANTIETLTKYVKETYNHLITMKDYYSNLPKELLELMVKTKQNPVVGWDLFRNEEGTVCVEFTGYIGEYQASRIVRLDGALTELQEAKQFIAEVEEEWKLEESKRLLWNSIKSKLTEEELDYIEEMKCGKQQ